MSAEVRTVGRDGPPACRDCGNLGTATDLLLSSCQCSYVHQSCVPKFLNEHQSANCNYFITKTSQPVKKRLSFLSKVMSAINVLLTTLFCVMTWLVLMPVGSSVIASYVNRYECDWIVRRGIIGLLSADLVGIANTILSLLVVIVFQLLWEYMSAHRLLIAPSVEKGLKRHPIQYNQQVELGHSNYQTDAHSASRDRNRAYSHQIPAINSTGASNRAASYQVPNSPVNRAVARNPEQRLQDIDRMMSSLMAEEFLANLTQMERESMNFDGKEVKRFVHYAKIIPNKDLKDLIPLFRSSTPSHRTAFLKRLQMFVMAIHCHTEDLLRSRCIVQEGGDSAPVPKVTEYLRDIEDITYTSSGMQPINVSMAETFYESQVAKMDLSKIDLTTLEIPHHRSQDRGVPRAITHSAHNRRMEAIKSMVNTVELLLDTTCLVCSRMTCIREDHVKRNILLHEERATREVGLKVSLDNDAAAAAIRGPNALARFGEKRRSFEERRRESERNRSISKFLRYAQARADSKPEAPLLLTLSVPPPDPIADNAKENKGLRGNIPLRNIIGFIGLQDSGLLTTLTHAVFVILANVGIVYGLFSIPRTLGATLINAFNTAHIENIMVAIASFSQPAATTIADVVGQMNSMVLFYVNSLAGPLRSSIPPVLLKAISTALSIAFPYLNDLMKLIEIRRGSFSFEVFQLSLGYTAMACIMSAYIFWMSRRSHGIQLNFEITIARYCLLLGGFVKLAFVFAVELILVPLVCGWILDVSSLPLFGLSWSHRLASYQASPYVMSIAHWIAGWLFVNKINQVIVWCRSQFRPGLLYFIRNGKERKKLIYRDIIQCSYLDHIAHLSTLIFFNSSLIVAFTGVPCYLLRRLLPHLLPFHLSYENTVSGVAFDLLTHSIAQLFFDSISPPFYANLLPIYIKKCLKLLRLSSYFYGGRFEEEEIKGETFIKHFTYVPCQDRPYDKEILEEMYVKDVNLVEISRLHIHVASNPYANPLLHFASSTPPTSPPAVIAAQPGAHSVASTLMSAAKALSPRASAAPPITSPLSRTQLDAPRRRMRVEKNNTEKGFTCVYVPDLMFPRLVTLMTAVWVFWVGFITVMGVAPLLIGRTLITLIPHASHHDVPALGVGLVVVGALLKILSYFEAQTKAHGFIEGIKEALRIPLLVLKILLVFSFVFGTWPLLSGVLFVLIISPFTTPFTSIPSDLNSFTVIDYPSTWIIGLIILKLLYSHRHSILTRNQSSILDALRTLNGWMALSLSSVLLQLLIPVTAVIATCLSIPYALVGGVLAPLATPSTSQAFVMMRFSLIACSFIPPVYYACRLASSLQNKSTSEIRDEMMQAGRRIVNYNGVCH